MSGERPPVIWHATMGAAVNLGSEPMVGMQWINRLRQHGPVQSIIAGIFDDSDFLPVDQRAGIHFIDTGHISSVEFAGNPLRHIRRWWFGVRAHLKAHARPQDRLFITAPAAIWMLPWTVGLPIPRDRIFFGPMGADWLPRALRASRWPGMRNMRTAGAIAAWRLFAPWLPANLALRAPFDGFGRWIGPRFRLLGAMPEVEPPPMQMAAGDRAAQCVALLYDARPRKRFWQSLGLAIALAAEQGLPVSVVGAPAEAQAAIAAQASAAHVPLEQVARMTREAFQAWLIAGRPDFVSLSASEGVSSTLIEALLAGCRLHVHDVGGIHWLIGPGIEQRERLWNGASVWSFRWDAGSLQHYAENAHAAFEGLLAALLPAPPGARAAA